VTTVCVLVPVLGRPHRAAPTAETVRGSDSRASVLFLCSPGDTDQIAAARATGESVIVVPWTNGPGDYARKMNLGYSTARARHEWVFLGADDIFFHPGWFDACLREHVRAAYACVVGTNDLGNQRTMRGHHSTHTLVHRGYLDCGTIDEDGKILHEGYSHNYVDDEFIQTAQARRTYAHAHDALVEHLHPNWRKGSDDATYQLGMQRFQDDRILYERRRALWEPLWRRRG